MNDGTHKPAAESTTPMDAADSEYTPDFLLDDFGASYLRGHRDPFVDAPASEWSAAA